MERFRVGNDVVDLAHPRCRTRRSPDPLVRRILTPRERDWLAAGPDPKGRARRLWGLWAGKETAFKVVTKLEGSPPVFRHRAFEVELTEEWDEGLVRFEGLVRWGSIGVRVEGVATDHFLHLVGWGPSELQGSRPVLEMGVEGCAEHIAPGFVPLSVPGEDPGARPQEDEGGVRGPLSRRARRVARARLAGHVRRRSREGDTSVSGEPVVQIVTSRDRPGRSPPKVLVNGAPRPELDLSLSHHGRYVGWAILLPSGWIGAGREEAGEGHES